MGLAFMASSPQGQHELDFEAEEAAILHAVGELADHRAAAVVRLGLPYCHRGRRYRSSAAGVWSQGRARPGCRWEGLVAHSLATALVTAGVPGVIGCDGSVNDQAATIFAERLYRGLADRADLPVAVGNARRVLLKSDDPLLRAIGIWLGWGWDRPGAGPLVAGNRKRSLVSATHGTKTFLDRKHQVPVAAAQMFVRRRPELQQALRGVALGSASRGAAARAGPAG